ncbi:hypothetical protein LAZ67_15002155 [Cordylochernes scorpioides]|uniref:Claudin n=1 Tax=Cordylochernes scorpioides TaxID=51811 RepID=A0ABY6LBF0_9ARAC|nr:hypothetical protein LAZ67_15002155 [Cordylochernes scorpioides]
MNKKITELRLACYIVLGLSFVLVFIAFSTSNWLASDLRVYGSAFVKIGLWEACFRSFVNREDLNLKRFYAGCRWVLTEEYQSLANILEPLGFSGFVEEVLSEASSLCIFIDLTSCLLKDRALFKCLKILKHKTTLLLLPILQRSMWTISSPSVTTLCAGVCGLISIIVFGTLGHGREWMPQPEHNYLSWSFGLAVVGVFFMFVAAVLFFVESVQTRKRLRREEAYAMNSQAQTQSKI